MSHLRNPSATSSAIRFSPTSIRKGKCRRSTASGKTTKEFASAPWSSSTSKASCATSTFTTSAKRPTTRRSSKYCANCSNENVGGSSTDPRFKKALSAESLRVGTSQHFALSTMLNIARRCVPFTPFDKELSTAIVTLVSATGVHLPDQTPFPEEDPGDTTYRLIPGDVALDSLRLTHHHYDHAEADTDPNIVFPIQTLRELASDNVIAS